MTDPAWSRQKHPTSRASAIQLVLYLFVLISYAALFVKQLHSGLEFDESYNLTVSVNLAEGHGYAAQGAIHDAERLLFDPMVSTGPTLLVPAAAVWHLGGGSLELVRLVALAFFALYLGGAWLLGRRLGGRWGALAALASPLLVDVGIPDLSTLSLVPGRLVGEFTACALLVWAALLLPRTRTPLVLVGGLCAGLAFETKANVVVAIVIVGSTWFVAETIAARRLPWVRGAAAVLGVSLPILAFEAYRWVSLRDGYGDNIEALREFVAVQSHPPTLVDLRARLDMMGEVLTVPGLLVVAAAAAFCVGWAIFAARSPRTASGQLTVAGVTSTSLVLAGLVLGGLWIFTSNQASPRQGLPTLLLCLPPVMAFAAARTSTLLRGVPDVWRGVAGAAALSASLAVIALAFTAIVRDQWHGDLLTHQQAAARAIERSGTPSIMTRGWWMHAEYQLLTGLPHDRAPGVAPATVLITTPIESYAVPQPADQFSADASVCSGEVLYRSWAAVVCRAG